MKRSSLPALTVATGLGAAVWGLSPWVTGQAEPWDTAGIYYSVALVLGGLLSGLVVVRPVWAHYVGALLGQFLYQLFFLPLGPLIAVGFIFLSVWSILFLGGAFVGSRIRSRFDGRGRAA